MLMLYTTAGLTGCASWEDSAAGSSFELPAPRMSPDSVVLEIAFVNLPADSSERFEKVWQSVDEQRLPNELRRNLASNGLRTGIVGAHLPDLLRDLLDRDDELLNAPTSGRTAGEDAYLRRRRLPIRAHQPAKIVATPDIRDRLVVVYHDQGHVRAKDFELAQGVFSLLSIPQGDGRVKLQLIPTVEHGELRNRYVGGDGTFLLQPERETHTFDALRVEFVLSPGETVVLTGTADRKGIGGHFFRAAENPEANGTLMLIRLAQTQFDDLFADQPSPAPVTEIPDLE